MAALGGLGADTPAKTTGTDWGAVIASAIPAVVAARNQDKVMRLNIQREAAGLKPLDIENYQPGVKVGIDPNTRKMLIGLGLATILVIGGVMYNNRSKRGAR